MTPSTSYRELVARLACVCVVATVPAAAHAQDVLVQELEPPDDGLEWSSSVSDVAAADLTGLWRFVESSSDPMLEAWRGRAITYEISQQTDRVVMTFRPEGGEPNVHEYRWDGTVNSFERSGAQVRERARWRDGGRTLEVEGRWWPVDNVSTVFKYTFRYRLEAPRRLLLRQIDEYAEIEWRFVR